MRGGSRKRLAPDNYEKPLEFSEDIISPITVDELAVQKAKLKEVQAVFQDFVENHTGTLLIMYGPSGSGKTATVKVLCNGFNLGLSVWRSQDIISNEDSDYIINPTAQLVSYLKYNTGKSSVLKIPGIRPKPKSQVILIDSLPYMHTMEQKELFRATLRNVMRNYDKLIVINISDTSKSYVERLFGHEILQKAHTVNYNAVTKKFMLIALKRVCDRLNWPESSFDLEGIAQISSGDLHAALSALQLSGMRMSPSAKRLKTDEKFVSSEKDEMLLIFHALGKFLYNKRNIHSGFDSAGKVKQIPWEQMQGIKPGLYFNPESVLRSVESDLGVFNMMLYENYLDFFGEIEDVVEGLEGFMLSDKIDSYKFLYESEDFNLALLSSSIFGRSILDSNCHPSPPKALNKFRKPRYLQMHKVIQENKESLLLKWGSSLRDESLETTIQEIWAFERRRENSNIDSVLITQAEEELDSLNIDV